MTIEIKVPARFITAARRNVDRYLGDCFTPEETYGLTNEDVAEEAWNLAFDGAKDAGASFEEARAVAAFIKKEFE